MRLEVKKTYKMLVGGNFVRSESDRTLEQEDAAGAFVANVPRATRKDVRDAVKAARSAFPGWAARTAYNRGQILYRMAEMLEARADHLVKFDPEIGVAIDRCVYYAGWCDKYTQLLGQVNPVAAPYFCFSMPEPMGVVALFATGDVRLGAAQIFTLACGAVAGGNSVVIVADETLGILACELGEVVATADVPAGVLNILTGHVQDIGPHVARHMDVNAIGYPGDAPFSPEDAVDNLKRLRGFSVSDWSSADCETLMWIESFQETKTVWHPVGV